MNPCNLFQDYPGQSLHLSNNHAIADQNLGAPGYPCPICAAQTGADSHAAANLYLERAQARLERQSRGQRESWVQNRARMEPIWDTIPNRIVGGRTPPTELQHATSLFNSTSTSQQPSEADRVQSSTGFSLSRFMAEHAARQERLRQLPRPSIGQQQQQEQAEGALIEEQERIIRRVEDERNRLVREQERVIQEVEIATHNAPPIAPIASRGRGSSRGSPQPRGRGSSEARGGRARRGWTPWHGPHWSGPGGGGAGEGRGGESSRETE